MFLSALNVLTYYYRPQGEVMFSEACDIPFRVEGGLHLGVLHRGGAASEGGLHLGGVGSASRGGWADPQ